MIKARKNNLIILGLSDKNLEKLKEGKPIWFNAKEHLDYPHDLEIFIFNGKDEESMKQEMMKQGMVNRDTTIYDLTKNHGKVD